jgi:pSer/pThr/pTyr-binding forkhead associated (FHA) protein
MAKSIQVFIVTVQEGENVDYKIVDDSTFTVGRSLDATLAFSDQNISRIHLIVTLKHNKIWVEDQGSANGTFVNDQKIPSQKTVSVEPGDKVKIGKSEIYLSFNLLEKCFKKEEIVKSQLPKDEKDSVMRLVQGAHAEAQRIVKLAQEGHDKLIKIAEQKATSIENEMLLKQDDILSNASMQASQIVQDAKRKGVGVINDAQQEAEKTVQDIYTKANEFKKESEDYYKNKLEEAQSKSQEILKQNETLANKIVEDARHKVAEMREFAQNEMEQLKNKSLLEIEELKKSILEDAESEKETILQRTEREAQKKMQVLLTETAENAKLEKEKLIAGAHREIEKIKMDSASEIDNLKNEIIHLNKDVEKIENEIKVLDSDKKNLQTKLDKEEQDKRKELEEQLRLKQESFEKSLDEKRLDFEERLKKRQEFAERDITARYNDLEVEEERRNKELTEFKGSLKKKEDEFNLRLNKEKEIKLKELEEREKFVAEQEVKVKKEAQEWADALRSSTTAWEQKIRSETTEWDRNLKAETNNWVETTKSKLQKEWDDRDIQLRNYESQKRNETHEWVKAEQKKKEQEWSLRETELKELEDKKNKEVEAWVKEKQEEFFNRNKFLIDENVLLESRTKELRVVFEDTDKKYNQVKAEFEHLTKENAEFKVVNEKFKEENAKLLKQQDMIVQDTKFVEKKLGEMKYELSTQQSRVDSIAKDFESQKAHYKSQLDVEQQKMLKASQEQVNQMKLLEIEKLNTLKEGMLTELYKNKETISKDIHRAIEKELITIMPPSQYAAMSGNIYNHIMDAFEEHTASMSTDSDSDKGQLKKDANMLMKKQKRERSQFVGMGMLMGMLLFFIGSNVYTYVQEKQNPVSEKIAEQAEQMKQDLNEKKFNPPRIAEIKDSYVDLVLYTDQFTEIYLSADFHDKWGKAAMDYLLKTWRVEEEKSIQIVSMAHTLVKTLVEKKETVRTDFLEQGLSKMKDIETESSNKIVEILGSQVKFESFRKFERKYFREALEKFYLARNSDPQSDKDVSSGDLKKQIEGEIEQSSESK